MKAAVVPVAALVLFVVGLCIEAGEQKVPLKDVPKPVIDAVRAKFPKAELKEATKETGNDGKVTYEISLVNQRKNVTVSLDPKGEIAEIETEIAVKELPKSVTDALAGKYPKATLKKAEEVVEIDDGKEEKEYEVLVVTAEGKSIEVNVEANGRIKEDQDDDD